MLDLARLAPGLSLADVEMLDGDRVFDRVICAGVLEFVADARRALRNLCALVAPGGWLVVLTARTGPGGWLYRAEKAAVGLRVNLFDAAWLAARARESGLSPDEVRWPLPVNVALSARRAC